jgi:aldose sugar dehydrogenase
MPPASLPTPRTALLVATLAALAFTCSAHAQQFRTGQVADSYAQNCASCHGANLQGGSAPSMLDDVWSVGGDPESLARAIRDGVPEKGMPAWGQVMEDKDVRAMVIYLQEQRTKFQNGQITFPAPADSISVQSELHTYQLNTWVGGLDEPYSLAFLSADRAIVTEKKGALYVIENGQRAAEPIKGLPEIFNQGQGGLYDVVPHPQYAQNGWIYFAFADPGEGGSMTRIVRGKLQGNELVDVQTIFQARADLYIPASARVHWGGRMVFDRDGMLFFSVGERGQRDHAQDVTRPNGKVHRLHDDGRIPAGNPFVGQADAVQSIWSFGHRNPQGLAFHPVTGALYDLEHGPRGGDELNHVEKGRNYGWPVITYGIEYSGAGITELTHKEGMEQPITYWVPSLAVCGMNFYTGDLFPQWKNHLFISSLAAEELRRLEIKDGQVVKQEIIFKGLGRIRHVVGGPDGALYAMLPNRIARIAPVQ